MKAERRGGRAATCGRLVWGEPNGFSLIGRAICHSWDGLQGRILPLKGSGETGIQQSVDREDEEDKESQKYTNQHQGVASADSY